MEEIGRRRRRQPAPPHVVQGALVEPDSDPARPWLTLLHDEVRPEVVAAEPSTVIWSSIWTRRPDARIHFDLPPSSDGGTDLQWTLLVGAPPPDAGLTGHMCKRLNQLINAELRYSFGQ